MKTVSTKRRGVQTPGKQSRSGLKPVSVQGVTIPIYTFRDGRFAFSDHFGGKRKVRTFVSEERARAEAEACAMRILRGDTIRHDLSTRDVQAFTQMSATAARHGSTPALAVEEWAKARELCHGRSLLDVLRSGLEVVSRPAKTFREVTEMFLASKRMEGVSAIYLAELTEDLTSFGKSFGDTPIAAIGTEDVSGWLASRTYLGRQIGPRRRNNIRGTLVTLFKFAQTRQPSLLPAGPTAPQLIGKAKDKRNGAVSVYTPEEMRFWLEHARPEFLPWVAIGGFSGVRTEEICPDPNSEKDRLRWSDFNWKKAFINVRPETSKTSERRMVPILDNLAAWLENYKDSTGPVIPLGMRTDREAERLSRMSVRLTKNAEKEPGKYHHPCPGLVWRRNALRHSYCSYRMAIIKNAPQVAYEAGNSVSMIKRHYHEAQEEDVAKAYHEILPRESAGNVVQFRLQL